MQRSIVIDALRSSAILLMVAYHIAYDLAEFHHVHIDVNSGLWWVIGRSSAVIFLAVSGYCFGRSWGRRRSWMRSLQRSIRFAGYAAVVSAATYMMDATTWIQWGVLHLMAASALLLPFFSYLKEWNVIVGIMIVAGAQFLRKGSENSVLLILGWQSEHFLSIDYYPLIPWFGYILIGLAVSHLVPSVRIQKKRQPAERAPGPLAAVIQTISRNSLHIYMLHQPVLLGVLQIMW